MLHCIKLLRFLVMVLATEKRLTYAIRANLLNQSEAAILLFEQSFELVPQVLEHIITVILLIFQQAAHHELQWNRLLFTQEAPLAEVVQGQEIVARRGVIVDYHAVVRARLLALGHELRRQIFSLLQLLIIKRVLRLHLSCHSCWSCFWLPSYCQLDPGFGGFSGGLLLGGVSRGVHSLSLLSSLAFHCNLLRKS